MYPVHACVLSHVWLFETSWTIAHQAPLSMGFPRQESWSGLPFPSPEDLPDPGTEPTSLALTGEFFTTSEPPVKPMTLYNLYFIYIVALLSYNSHIMQFTI